MAKYQITHSCGHHETHNIVGTNVNNERERKAKWLAGNPCYACYKAAQEAERAKASAEAAAQAETDGLPALAGSDKQVAWALTIRATAKRTIDAAMADLAARGKLPGPVDQAAIAKLFGTVEAAYWIDHRDCGDNRSAWGRVLIEVRKTIKA